MFKIKKQSVIVSSGFMLVFLIGLFVFLGYRQASRQIEQQIELSVINKIQRMRMKAVEFAPDRADPVIIHLESTALTSISLNELIQNDYLSVWEHSVASGQMSSSNVDKQLEITDLHHVMVFVFAIEEIKENQGSIEIFNFWPRDGSWGLEISDWTVTMQSDGMW